MHPFAHSPPFFISGLSRPFFPGLSLCFFLRIQTGVTQYSTACSSSSSSSSICLCEPALPFGAVHAPVRSAAGGAAGAHRPQPPQRRRWAPLVQPSAAPTTRAAPWRRGGFVLPSRPGFNPTVTPKQSVSRWRVIAVTDGLGPPMCGLQPRKAQKLGVGCVMRGEGWSRATAAAEMVEGMMPRTGGQGYARKRGVRH